MCTPGARSSNRSSAPSPRPSCSKNSTSTYPDRPCCYRCALSRNGGLRAHFDRCVDVHSLTGAPFGRITSRMSSLPYRLGDSGPAIAEIRGKLVQIGMLVSPTGSVSDEFDRQLDLAVRHFQQDRGLVSNGVVDTTTYRLLDEARWRLGDRLLSYVVTNPLVGDDVMAL